MKANATIEEVKALFPLKGKLTRKILKNSDVYDIENCNGTNTLRQALLTKLENLEEFELSWADIDTNNTFYRGVQLKIGTEESISFMEATEPQEVIFILL